MKIALCFGLNFFNCLTIKPSFNSTIFLKSSISLSTLILSFTDLTFNNFLLHPLCCWKKSSADCNNIKCLFLRSILKSTNPKSLFILQFNEADLA